MTKNLTYFSFVIASGVIILIFITATTYSQLASAVILYPALIFIALKIFPRIDWGSPKILTPPPPKFKHEPQTATLKAQPAYIADVDKRFFIKFIGAAGISFFLFSLLGRRVEDLILGRTGGSGINSLPSTSSNQFGLDGPSPTNGYKISEISEGPITYYGYINQDGAWIIMRQDTNENSFRYQKGSSNFPASWQNRENLKYDYFYKLF